MTEIKDLFNPAILFSKENPFLKSAEKTHRLVLDAFDRSARLQLAFAEDLLDMNRQRFDALYANDSLQDRFLKQQDLATEFGKRAATLAGDLQEVAVELRSHAGEAANDFISPAAARKPAEKSKKTKAA